MDSMKPIMHTAYVSSRGFQSDVERPSSTPPSTSETPAEFLKQLEKQKNLRSYFLDNDNKDKAALIFFNLLKDVTDKTNEITADPSFIKIFRLLYDNNVLSYQDFNQIESAFLDPNKLQLLTPKNYDELLMPFVNHNKGSSVFYQSLSESFIQKMGSKIDDQLILKTALLFVEANAYSENYFQQTFEYIKSLLKERTDQAINLRASSISSIAFFLSLEYERTREIHESFYNVLKQLFTEKKQSFFQTVQKQTHLKYLWYFLKSLEVHDPDLFIKMDDQRLIDKIPYNLKEQRASEEQLEVFKKVVSIVGGKDRVVSEMRIDRYFADIFIQPKTIIEVNSFKHYFNAKKRRSGSDAIRYRHLTAMGYNVKELDLNDWHTIRAEDQEKFLKRFISEKQRNNK